VFSSTVVSMDKNLISSRHQLSQSFSETVLIQQGHAFMPTHYSSQIRAIIIFRCISLQTCTTSSSSIKANQKSSVPKLSVPSVFQYPVDIKNKMLLTLQHSVAWTIYTMFLHARLAADATASASRQAGEKAQLYEASSLALYSCWCIYVVQPSLLCIGMCGFTKSRS